ncbi:helix-turn-helix domain-containing protein [Paenibacillus polymyxa]|uniref:helix-turn-helix domain-containing protein n=1 Tax=Paenibacillus polymyxa TaxID=1406 RepID=UPI00111BC83F|nr:helix-turn-helix transcriptional regulator [Paenibacillus polymyxa]QDA30238.1 helix-turn-helix transcriptional regulator [Paenibacillus polymyxa]
MNFNLGMRMKSIRKGKGVTIDELHERTGIARANLSRWETNKSTPTLDSLKRWAEGLNIDLEEIFFIELAAEEVFLVSSFRNLNNSDKLHIVSLIKSLTRNQNN